MAVVLALGMLAVASCGGSAKTETRTVVVRTVTETVATTGDATTPSTQPTTTTPSPSPGKMPALNGTYAVTQTSAGNSNALYNFGGIGSGKTNPHDGIDNADRQWVGLGGSCTQHACTVNFRRVMSDNLLEGMILVGPNATGNYTGHMPGTVGETACGNGLPIKERLLVRLGGVRQINGRQVATRLAGVITAYYRCPGQSTTDIVATYTGTRTS